MKKEKRLLNTKIESALIELRGRFSKMVMECPPHDYYSYWPGDETRPCVHAFQTTKELQPFCKTCGETITDGIHIRNRETGKEYDYTIKRLLI